MLRLINMANTFLSQALKSTTDLKDSDDFETKSENPISCLMIFKIVFTIMIDSNRLVPEMLCIIFWTKA